LKGSAAMMTQYNHRGQNYFKANNMINLGFEAPPEGPDMINHNYVYFAGGNHIYYPSYLKDKEEVMNAVSYWWSIWDSEKEGSWSFDDIIQSQLGEVLYSERDLLANRRAVKNQQLMQFGNFPELKGLMDQNVFKKIVNREVSVTSAVESIMQQAQTHIDSIIQK
jgi:hypothetical protein